MNNKQTNGRIRYCLYFKEAFYWSCLKMHFGFRFKRKNSTSVCRLKTNIWAYFMADNFEAIYTEYTKRFPIQWSIGTIRQVITTLIYLANFFLLKSLFWSSNLSLGTLKILYSPVVIRIEDLFSLIFDQTLVKWDRLCICLENQNTNVCKRTQVSHNLFPTTKISRTVYR